MVVECAINVGFHSNVGTFRQSEYSKIPLRFAFINGFPLNPTYSLFFSFMGFAFYSPGGDQANG